jgi:hypothetical protein
VAEDHVERLRKALRLALDVVGVCQNTADESKARSAAAELSKQLAQATWDMTEHIKQGKPRDEIGVAVGRKAKAPEQG